MFPFDFSSLGEKSGLVVAGALGGVVRWLTLRDKWQDGVVAIVVGAIGAAYLAPLAQPALAPWMSNIGITSDSIGSLSGFLVGLGGVTVTGALIDAWRLWRRLGKKDSDLGAPK